MNSVWAPRRRTGPGSHILVPAALTTTAVALAAGLASLAAQGSRSLVLLPAAAVWIALLLTRPSMPAMVLLVTALTLFPQHAGALDIGGFRTDAVELMAYSLLALWGYRLVSGRLRSGTPYGWFAALLLLGTVVGTYIGLSHGATREGVQGQVKAYLIYLLLLPMADIFASEADRERLERAVVRIATVTCVVVLVLLVAGVPMPAGGNPDEIVTQGTVIATERIRPPVVVLLTLAIPLMVARVAVAGPTPARLGQLLLFVVIEALSFNRSTWLPLAIAVVIVAIARPGERRALRGLRVGLAVAAVITVTFGAAAQGVFGDTGRAVVLRARSTVSRETLTERSYADRQDENEKALATIAERPLLGNGIARPYGARRTRYVDNPPRIVVEDRLFIHNSFLGIWLHLGAAGILAVLALASLTLRAGLRARHEPDAARGARRLAAASALFAYGATSIFQTSLLHRPTIIAAAVAMALAVPVRTPRSKRAGP